MLLVGANSPVVNWKAKGSVALGQLGWHSPRVGVDLLKLNLVHGHDLTLHVEDDEARARRALVNGANEGGRCRGRHCVCVLC